MFLWFKMAGTAARPVLTSIGGTSHKATGVGNGGECMIKFCGGMVPGGG